MRTGIFKQGYIVFWFDTEANNLCRRVRKFLKEQDAKDFINIDLPSYSDAEIREMANDYDPAKFYERHQDNENVTYDYRVRVRIGSKEENCKLFIDRQEDYGKEQNNRN